MTPTRYAEAHVKSIMAVDTRSKLSEPSPPSPGSCGPAATERVHVLKVHRPPQRPSQSPSTLHLGAVLQILGRRFIRLVPPPPSREISRYCHALRNGREKRERSLDDKRCQGRNARPILVGPITGFTLRAALVQRPCAYVATLWRRARPCTARHDCEPSSFVVCSRQRWGGAVDEVKQDRWARSKQARHKPPHSEGGPCWYSMIGGQRRHFEHNAVEGGVASLKAPRPGVPHTVTTVQSKACMLCCCDRRPGCDWTKLSRTQLFANQGAPLSGMSLSKSGLLISLRGASQSLVSGSCE